ncbi:MAG: glycosyltransferase family 4 protein [Thermoleophilaceae bacterium]|nr:glycosyltransferase family 4 protein [Thermoleophilaceae bacterium]
MRLRLFLVPASAMLTDHRPHGDGLVGYGFIRELGGRGHDLEVAAGRVDLAGALPGSVRVHALGQDGPSRPAFMWRLRRLYERLARERPFDAVHQLTPVDVGVSLALPRDAPLVLGPYVPDWAPSGPGADREVGALALRVKRSLRRAQQARADAVLLSTAAAAGKLELNGSRRERVHELPLGVDAGFWRPAPSPAEGLDVLYLAGLEVRKGIHVLLDAWERLSPRIPEARLLLAGDGAERDAVLERLRSTERLARVELAGRLDREAARAAMQACAVFCLPSYGDPAPLAAVEAMACGRPVVATDASGLGKLVPDAGGIKVPQGDAGRLAEALAELLGDRDRREAMGASNRRAVEERYSWPRVVDRLEELYVGAASRRPGRGRP